MKKLLIVLLSLGLIAAFGTTASAVDVQFGGSYYVVGWYDSNSTLGDTGAAYSRAAFYQRVRLQPVFKIAEGLTFTARMDALERQWGNTSWSGTDVTSSRRNVTVNNPKIQESFEFERGYVTFATKIGQFQVGYQSTGKWGTDFGDSEATRSRILYITAAGPVTILALYEKASENDYVTGPAPATTNTPGGKADADADYAAVAGIYGFQGGSTGLLYYYIGSNAGRPAGGRFLWHVLAPYVKAQFGPVYVESEVMYTWGKSFESELPGVPDVDKSGWNAYLKAQTNLGPATIGAQVGWSAGAGNDPLKDKAGYGGGTDWNPALILMNDDFATWKPGGNDTANSGKQNFLLYQIFGSYNPTPKLTVGAALTVAQNDKLQRSGGVDFVSKKLGTEFDATATYKLYDNLSYMVGAGYLWAGDAWKGTNSAAVIGNDYMLMNKLTLSF